MVFLEIWQNLQEKTYARVPFLKSLWHRCFPVSFEKLQRILFLYNTSWRLLLCFQLSAYKNWRQISFQSSKKIISWAQNFSSPKKTISIYFMTHLAMSCWFSEAATRSVLCKKMFFEISQNPLENTRARDSETGVFLWIL